jgi:hypothetical protein
LGANLSYQHEASTCGCVCDDTNISSALDAGYLAARATETINFVANGLLTNDHTAATVDFIHVFDSAAKFINVSGNGILDLTLSPDVGFSNIDTTYTDTTIALTTLNASQNTGGLFFNIYDNNPSSISPALTNALTITGSQGVDYIDVTAANKTVTINETAKLNQGINGGDTLLVNALANTINLSETVGKENIIINSAAHSNEFSFDTISHFDVAGDSLSFLSNTLTSLGNVTLGVGAGFNDYVVAALDAIGTSTAKLESFVFGGNTFVVENATGGAHAPSAPFVSGQDVIVQLTGITNLSAISTVADGHLVIV